MIGRKRPEEAYNAPIGQIRAIEKHVIVIE
jgi:hypothetical protein